MKISARLQESNFLRPWDKVVAKVNNQRSLGECMRVYDQIIFQREIGLGGEEMVYD